MSHTKNYKENKDPNSQIHEFSSNSALTSVKREPLDNDSYREISNLNSITVKRETPHTDDTHVIHAQSYSNSEQNTHWSTSDTDESHITEFVKYEPGCNVNDEMIEREDVKCEGIDIGPTVLQPTDFAAMTMPLLQENSHAFDMGCRKEEPRHSARLRATPRNEINEHSTNTTHDTSAQETLTVKFDKNNGKYPCKTCGAEFTFKTNLNRHVMRFHNDGKVKLFICDVCRQTYVRKNSIIKHITVKHNKKSNQNDNPSVPCQLCCKVFNNDTKLRRHMSFVHLKRRNKKCDICSKKFVTSERFHLHKQQCTERRQEKRTQRNEHFPCQICTNSYRSLDTLRRHRNIHIPLKAQSQTCSICNVIYASRYSLKKHMTRKHTVNSQTQTKEPKTIKCENCPKMFDSMKKRAAHWRFGSCRYKPMVQCNICDRKFKGKLNLQAHMRIMHGQSPPYSCDRCSQNFAQKNSLTSHVIRCFDLK